MTLSAVIGITLYVHFLWCKKLTLPSLNAVYEHAEAIRQEDYNRRAKKVYSRGVFPRIADSLTRISEEQLFEKESRQSNALIIFQIMQDIQSPVIIITENNKLHSANPAYKKLYNRPWELDRHIDVARLNLSFNAGSWSISDPALARYWNVEAGAFRDGEQTFHLVIFSNVEASLYNEAAASQSQMFRVMNHEVRNSLTPIQSLAQALKLQPTMSEKNGKALQTIVNRCDSLMTFIQRYSELQKEITVNKENLISGKLIRDIEPIFVDLSLKVTGKSVPVFADSALLEQVLINLIQNARDAMAGKGQVELLFSSDYHYAKILVRDSGSGITNADNIFVPFYTTKPTGQGVGLALSKRLIQAQGGRISLTNRADQRGAEACILLPHSGKRAQ